MGIDVNNIQINQSLFGHQQYIVKKALQRGRCAVFAETGLGKSLCEIEFAHHVATHTGKLVLILTPLCVASQMNDEGLRFGYATQVAKSQSEVTSHIVITNYEKLHHFTASEFGGIVLDECFVKGTLIDTPDGAIPIELLREGDRIINAVGVDTIQDVHRREVKYAVKLTVNGQTITCSPNHPFFTQYGWVGAQDITPDHQIMATTEAMRMVQSGVCEVNEGSAINQSVLRSILFSEMANETARAFGKSSQSRSSIKTWQKQIRMATVGMRKSRKRIDSDSRFKSNVKSRVEGEMLPPIERDEAQTFRAWGQWDWLDDTSENLDGCIGRKLDSGIRFVTGQTSSKLSNLLQGRLSESRAKNSYRSGWQITSQQEISRRKKGCNAGFSWVESLEILEQGHPELERIRDEDGSLYFYDIGATQHPSFSVHGNLVHNSSILKSHDGEYRKLLTEFAQNIHFRMTASATPSPNDHMELGNQCEFLGVLTRTEMLATFFTHDGGETSKWRLKGHGRSEFWKWLSTWAIAVRKPSDLGFDDTGYNLPSLNVYEITVQAPNEGLETLFAMDAQSLNERRKAKKDTLEDRVKACADLVNNSDEQWIVWCNLNSESEMLTKSIKDAFEVKGADSAEHKESVADGFKNGDVRVLVSKPSIFGFGLNWEHCQNMAFVGLSDSFEQTYQAIKRCHRFGQQKEVNVHMISANTEGNIKKNIERKQQQHNTMYDEMIASMKEFGDDSQTDLIDLNYTTNTASGTNWELHLGDCVQEIKKIEDESIDYSIFSPPFASLYTYSASAYDMGNSADYDEFGTRFRFLIKELHRVIKSGRLVSFHCMNLPLSKQNDGVIGLRDFRGDLIRAFVEEGFIYHSEVVIWKDPVIAMQRTKAIGLLHKQVNKDSAMSRQGVPDYLVTMRKRGANENPVSGLFDHYVGDDIIPKSDSEVRDSINIWQRYASPVWMDINPSDTLQYQSARENDDERHVCPLQLQVIHRALQLWTNPDDVVLDPFNGIGSSGFESLKMNRRFVGFELKKSYFNMAVKNLKSVENAPQQMSLLD